MELTNAQKLALPPSTPVGTVVHVSDGFVVSGANSGNGLWVVNGTYNDHPLYQLVGGNPLDPSTIAAESADPSTRWVWYDGELGDNSYAYLVENPLVPNPWEQEWVASGVGTGTPTLTHPAVQKLAAPSSAQGGVAVLGGTQDGVYTFRGTNEGKQYGVLLGSADNSTTSAVSWLSAFDPGSGEIAAWFVFDDGGDPLYYSTTDSATPEGPWFNASDDSPASISVASVSVGEIYAGLFVTNDGATNGSSYVSQPFHGRQYYMGLNGGGSNNLHWDTDFNVWTDDVGVWTADNVIFPWQGMDNHTGHDGATFVRNDVANEANWVNS